MKEKYLVILGLMVMVTAIAVGFVFFENRNLPAQTIAKKQKTANPCLGLSANQGGTSCEAALAKAVALYPGKVNSVQFATIPFKQGSKGKSKDIQVWLVDINLKNPAKTQAGTMERIGLAIDSASSIDPFVNQFFPKAL